MVKSPRPAGWSGSSTSLARPSNPSRVSVSAVPGGRRSASSRRRSARFTLLLPLLFATEEQILEDAARLERDRDLRRGDQEPQLGDLARLKPRDDPSDAALQKLEVGRPSQFLLELVEQPFRFTDALLHVREGALDPRPHAGLLPVRRVPSSQCGGAALRFGERPPRGGGPARLQACRRVVAPDAEPQGPPPVDGPERAKTLRFGGEPF